MNCNTAALYQGEDKEFILSLPEPFEELTDVIVGISVNQQLQKTCWKADNEEFPTAVVGVPDQPNKCLFRVLRSESATWPLGHLIIEVTIVSPREGYEDGYHTTQVFRVGKVEEAKTRER